MGSTPCYSQSQIVYVYQVSRIWLHWFFWPKNQFWFSFFLNTERGVVILNMFSLRTNSRYVWVCGISLTVQVQIEDTQID